jgi:CheY-like chemotaxis protein
MGYGFNDYLSKPLRSDALLKILAHYLPAELKIKEPDGESDEVL